MRDQIKWNLLIRPYPLIDETLISYYYRISLLNCIPLRILIKPLLLKQEYQFPEIASNVLNNYLNLGITSEQINNLCGMHLQSYGLFNRLGVRYCPLCLKEERYFRVNWFIRWNLICLKHEMILLQKCPFCLANIDQVKVLSGRCGCGKYFCEMRGSQPDNDQLFAQKIIESKLGSYYIDGYQSHPVFSLPTATFSVFLELLMKYIVHYWNLISSHHYMYYTSEMKFCLELWTMAVNILKDWPKGFEKFASYLINVYKQSKRLLFDFDLYKKSHLFFRHDNFKNTLNDEILSQFFSY